MLNPSLLIGRTGLVAWPKHFAYTLHEMCDALRKYQRFGPWEIQTR